MLQEKRILKKSTIFDRDGRATLMENFLEPGTLDHVRKTIDWKQYSGRLFGKTVLYPRLNAYYGDRPYEYSGTRHEPEPFPKAVFDIKTEVEKYADFSFNAALLNYYRDGQDYLGWHSDSEKSLDTTLIASLSLGTSRVFKFRYKKDKSIIHSITLHDGSLLLMENCQEHWHHQVPKRSKSIGGRLNITFRRML